MPAEFFPVPTAEVPGRLWIMPAPCADHLHADIAEYRAAGITKVISMLARDEAKMLGLAEERAACAQAGIAFENHAIVDFGLPDLAGFHVLTHKIAEALRDGENIAVHCRAGIGRSGMVTAGVLIILGQTAQNAIEGVSNARGVSIPDTVEQGRFLTTFAEHLNSF